MGARVAPRVDTNVLLTLLAAFLIFAGAMMLFYRRSEDVGTRSRRAELTMGAGVGSVAGFLGGLLGVGGGNIVLPALNTAGLDAKVAAGTTGLVVVFSSLSGFLGRIAVGNLDGILVDPHRAVDCMCEFTPGQYLEVWIPGTEWMSRAYSGTPRTTMGRSSCTSARSKVAGCPSGSSTARRWEMSSP